MKFEFEGAVFENDRLNLGDLLEVMDEIIEAFSLLTEYDDARVLFRHGGARIRRLEP